MGCLPGSGSRKCEEEINRDGQDEQDEGEVIIAKCNCSIEAMSFSIITLHFAFCIVFILFYPVHPCFILTLLASLW